MSNAPTATELLRRQNRAVKKLVRIQAILDELTALKPLLESNQESIQYNRMFRAAEVLRKSQQKIHDQTIQTINNAKRFRVALSITRKEP